MERMAKQVAWLVEAACPILVGAALVWAFVWVVGQRDAIMRALGN